MAKPKQSVTIHRRRLEEREHREPGTDPALARVGIGRDGRHLDPSDVVVKGHVPHAEVIDRTFIVVRRIGRHLGIADVGVVRIHRPIGIVPNDLGCDRRIIGIHQRERKTGDISVE